MAVLTAEQVYAAARGAGATHQEAVILTAIAKGESGWRTDAHNPFGRDNSYGLWQINMLGSMGVNRAKQWGLSNYEQLFNPRTNAAAALSILRSQGWRAWTVYSKGIYKQYLPEAQAAGNRFQNDWQSPYRSLLTDTDWGSGVGSVIGGGGSGASLAGGGGALAPAGLPPNASPEQIEAHIRENYPQMAGFLDIPEIRGVLIEAARGQWTSTKLQAAIQATNWWRTNGEASRQYFALKSTDPAQLKALIDAKVAELGPQLAQLGIGPLSLDWRTLAEQAIQFGWSPDEVRARIADHLQKMSSGRGLHEGSTPDVTADRLMAMARSEYLVPIGRQDAERWAVDIFAGRKTEDQLRNFLQKQAEARFPGLAEGFTPGEYMAPVRNVIAETLELQPGDVDLLDRRWAAVLETEGADGKFRPMTIAEAQTWARSQQEYRYTQGARQEAAVMAETLGRTFGVVA